jgi:adenylate kinase
MQDNTLNTVIFIGRPGCGKGTQTAILAEHLGWNTFSTGNSFKKLRDEESMLGNRIRESFDKGKLMPDWFASYLFEEAFLTLSAQTGMVCEGFPRSLPQAELADDLLHWLSRPYKAIHLAISDEEAVRRQLDRSKTEDRPDSNDEAKIRNRLAVYRDQTEPALVFFKEHGTLIEINGEQSREAIADEVLKAVHAA